MSESTVAPDGVERYRRVLRTSAVSFRSGKPSAASTAHSEGQAVRLIEGGRLGVASRLGAASPDSEAWLLERAREAAAAGDPPGFAFPPGAPAAELPGGFSAATAALGPVELKQMGEQAMARIQAAAPDVVADLDLHARLRSSTLERTGAERQEERASVLSASVALSLPLDGDLINVEADVCARDPQGVVERAVDRALGWLAPARNRVAARGGLQRVLFAPEAVAALIDPLVPALDGLEVAVGSSPLASALGDAVLDSRLSLIDDGLAADGVASSRWDGEGVPRQRTALVQHGELRSFYHDQRSAARLGVASTGNAVRDDLLPVRAPGNWRLETEGRVPLGELYREGGDVLLVVALLGVGQTAARDGSFANPVALGFWISGGAVVGRVTDLTISGNALDLLRDGFVGAADDARWLTGLGFPLHAPTLLLEGVAVTAG